MVHSLAIDLIANVFCKYTSLNIHEETYFLIASSIVVTLGFILSFFRLQDIRWFSYFANFFAVFVAFILLFQLPDYYASLSSDPEIQYFIFTKDVFPAFGIALFAYTNHFSIISIIKILNKDCMLSKYKVS